MSGGRIELGLGTGWYEPEHDAYGIPFPSLGERFERLSEQLAIVTGLWETPAGERFLSGHPHPGWPTLRRFLSRCRRAAAGHRGRLGQDPRPAWRPATPTSSTSPSPSGGCVPGPGRSREAACEDEGRDPER